MMNETVDIEISTRTITSSVNVLAARIKFLLLKTQQRFSQDLIEEVLEAKNSTQVRRALYLLKERGDIICDNNKWVANTPIGEIPKAPWEDASLMKLEKVRVWLECLTSDDPGYTYHQLSEILGMTPPALRSIVRRLRETPKFADIINAHLITINPLSNLVPGGKKKPDKDESGEDDFSEVVEAIIRENGSYIPESIQIHQPTPNAPVDMGVATDDDYQELRTGLASLHAKLDALYHPQNRIKKWVDLIVKLEFSLKDAIANLEELADFLRSQK